MRENEFDDATSSRPPDREYWSAQVPPRVVADLHRLMVESVRDYAIFALDAGGRITTWNAGAERIKGYTAEEILGRHFRIFYPEDAQLAGKPEWELETAAREGRVEDEGWRVRKDGSRFWANVVVTALRDESGELVGFAKVTCDLSERRAAEEAARRLAEERAARAEAEVARSAAEAANRAKTDFLAVMSHELRTPLNAIGGYAELLALGVRGPLTDQQREDIERIQRSQRHLLSLINDVLNFARLDSGTVHYDIGRVPLRDVLSELDALIRPQADARGLSMNYATCEAELVARADADKVRQVLLNLLSNAVKFTGAGGRISVECEGARDRVLVHVRDTGRGVPPDKLDAIFEPFVQVDKGLTRTTEGAGLGLAISRQLARAMGGDITIRSEAGAGSTFSLALPRA